MFDQLDNDRYILVTKRNFKFLLHKLFIKNLVQIGCSGAQAGVLVLFLVRVQCFTSRQQCIRDVKRLARGRHHTTTPSNFPQNVSVKIMKIGQYLPLFGN